MTAPIASGWSESPGGACTHWKAPPLHGARRVQTFGRLVVDKRFIRALDKLPRSHRVVDADRIAPRQHEVAQPYYFRVVVARILLRIDRIGLIEPHECGAHQIVPPGKTDERLDPLVGRSRVD